MRLIQKLRPVFLRWDRLLALAALALPFVAAVAAGFLWMAEKGLILHFIGASIALGGLVTLIRLVVRYFGHTDADDGAQAPERIHLRMEPEWSEAERNAFRDASAFIAEQTRTQRPWDDLQPLALEVVDLVARSSGKGKGRLDFTVPEALLLIERVASRFRADVRAYVPLSDRISLSTLQTIWTYRAGLQQIYVSGKTAWRVFRAVKSLPVALLREVEGLIAQGHATYMTQESTASIQALLLEEVAAAAIDLYSGRLRFSDSELLELRIAAGDQDRERLAAEDAPVRIAVAGQVSVGKSSLINALLGADLAETDMPATTDRARTYPAEIEGVPCMLLDLPGLDGSRDVKAAVMNEVTEADMVIWVLRANRPAREIDRDALDMLRGHFTERPERRAPPLLPVVTCVDTLTEGWPFPENLLPRPAMRAISSMVGDIARDIGTVHPVQLVLTKPDWNVESLRSSVEGALIDALMTQRNRARLTHARTSAPAELARAGRGFVRGLGLFGGRTETGRDED